MSTWRGSLVRFLVGGAVFFGAALPSRAALRCEDAFRGEMRTPYEILTGALSPTDLDRARSARRFIAKLRSIDANREFSEADVRSLVSDLQDMKLGKTNSRRFTRLSSAEYVDARLMREMQVEIGARGLIDFYRERGLLVDRSRFKTKLRHFFADRRSKALFTALQIPTLFTHRPFFFLPYDNRVELTPRQFETLLVEGSGSPEGRRVLAEIEPLAKSQRNRDVFVRNFNRVSFLVSVVVIYFYVVSEEEEKAKERGDALLASFAERAAAIQARGEPDTKEDLHFDATRKRLEESQGRPLTNEELGLICLQIPAPGRCASDR